jgi:glucokinase
MTKYSALAEDIVDGIVIDIGGTKVMIGIVKDGVAVELTTFPTREGGSSTGITSAISRASLRLAHRHNVKIQAAAVAVPGELDRDAGVVRWAANLPFNQFPLASELSRAMGGIPVTIEHDANFGVVGEALYGAAKGLANVAYLTVSTGIGMGILINGRLLKGSRGTAGEIGHVSFETGERICACGATGCLEAYASGEGIAQLGREAVADGMSPVLASLVVDPAAITSHEVLIAAEMGDEGCAGIIDGAIDLLTVAINMVFGILDPEVMVLGGGVMSSSYLTERLISETAGDGQVPRVRVALLGRQSVIFGGIRFLTAKRSAAADLSRAAKETSVE